LRESTAAQVAGIKTGLPYHSLELPDGETIAGLIPVAALRRRLDLLGVPQDLHGLEALDIGAASGWNSFEMERRGARVTALDYVPYEEFVLFKERTRSDVQYVIADFERLTPEQLRSFDIVLFLGVLYHLRNPLLALETLCAVCRGTAYIESYVFDSHHESGEAEQGPAICEFYETDELAGQIDNWWGPSRRAVSALCRAAGFTRVDFRYLDDRRAGVVCSRRPFEPPAVSITAPFLSGVASNRTELAHFIEKNDEYLNIYFDATSLTLDRHSIHVRFDDFGVPVLTLSSLGGKAFQCTVRLPYWAGPGIHEVRVGTADSAWSNPALISVAPATGPQTGTQRLFIEEIAVSPDSSWSTGIRIHEASVTARRTAFWDRVLDVSAFLDLGQLPLTLEHEVALSVNGRWFTAVSVNVTPGGLLQVQLLRVLDRDSGPLVVLCAAVPALRQRSPDFKVPAQ
jgi:tRNA (mo5U34)-methyltransferase